jgi:hypothetical protein
MVVAVPFGTRVPVTVSEDVLEELAALALVPRNTAL